MREKKTDLVNSNIKIRNISTYDALFFLLFGLWALFSGLNWTKWKEVFPITKTRDMLGYTAYIPLVVHLYQSRKMDISKCLSIFGFLVVAALSAHFSQNPYILFMAIWVICARNIDLDRLFTFYLGIMCVNLLLTVGAVKLGFFENVLWPGERLRYAWGYTFCADLSYMVLFISLTYIALRKRLGFLEFAALLVANLWTYKQTDTKVCVIIAVLILTIAWISGFFKMEKICFNLKKAATLVVPIAMLVSLTAQYLYTETNSYFVKADAMLSNRLRLGHAGLTEMKVTWFGQYIKWIGTTIIQRPGYNYVDNFFARYAINQGVVYLLIIVIGYSYACYVACYKKRWGLFLAIVGIVMYGVIDPTFADLRYQPFMFVMTFMFADHVSPFDKERQ